LTKYKLIGLSNFKPDQLLMYRKGWGVESSVTCVCILLEFLSSWFYSWSCSTVDLYYI